MPPGDQGPEMLVMARYGELFLKSEPVKRHFISLLVRNIHLALEAAGLQHRIETPRGRVLIRCRDHEAVAGIVSRTFGIVDVSICAITDPDSVCRVAGDIASASLRPGMRFAVRAKRERKTGMTSQELAAAVGLAVCRLIPGSRVGLDNPDYELHVEVRDAGYLVYDTRVEGPGGMPAGSQGRVLSLISSGIDSPVASWLAMKRGCDLSFVHFDAGRWAGPDVRKTAVENLRRLSFWSPGAGLPMTVIGTSPLYDAMVQHNVPQRFRCVICKRFMLSVAEKIMEQEGACAIVTGENLGQVASQTLANLAVISGAASVPVLRPLITYDKEETITIARRIGTYDPHPGDLSCRAVPSMPATAADPAAVMQYETQIGTRGLERAVLETKEHVIAMNGRIISPT